MKANVLILLSIMFLASCAKDVSENVNQNSIYTIYELNYDSETDKTTSKATFRFGGVTGTLLDLSEPAEVTFGTDVLAYNVISGVHNKDYAGFVESGTFSYTDLDENTFVNETGTIVPITIPAIDSVDVTEAFTFTWEGEPVGENEIVSLTIDGTQQVNFEIFAEASVGATSVVLDVDKMQNLGLGEAKLYLKRTHLITEIDQSPDEGGRMSRCYTDRQTIILH